MSKVTCNLCHHRCKLSKNQVGLCKARKNIDEKIVSINYGSITSIALDSIEKKPVRRFQSGKNILSVGSFGCNLKCPFCQNYQISMASKGEIDVKYLSPEELVDLAISLEEKDNIGIAYTYNEPLIGYEFVRDTSILAREKGLKNVVVTNGCFNVEAVEELFPYIDAFNIDLKGFTEEFYKKIGGDLETVKKFILTASKYSHVEVTTLVIPGENDSEDEIRQLSEFLGNINPDIPLHISRFFPSYKMYNKEPTDVEKVYRLAEIARKNLKYVYEGNC